MATSQKSTRNPVYQFFHGQTVEMIKPDSPEIITLTTEDVVETAVSTFSQNGILSAPVIDKNTGELQGLVDMLDIANFVLKVVPVDEDLEPDHLASLNMAGRAMALKPLKDVMDASGRDPACPVNYHNPSSLLIDLFATGMHRVPVFCEDEKKVVNLVSQSDLISWLANNIHMGKLKYMGEKSLTDLGLGQGGVISGSLTDRVITLIRLLDQQNVSGVALVDEGGKLVGNFSVTDLKGLWKEVWPTFVLDAREYLERHHPRSLDVATHGVLPLEGTNLKDVIRKMAGEKVHRVWIIDEFDKPTGVVSMTDVMKAVRDFDLTV